MANVRRLDLLVRDARDQSNNQRFGSTQGVPQREFVRYANDAQERIYNKMLQEHPSLFCKEGFLNSVAGQASYALPTDVYLKHNIIKVDYSHNGSASNYITLKLRTPRQEISESGYPEGYFLRDGRLIASPIPSNSITNAFRLNYQYTIPTLDVRRAQITSYSSGGTNVTSITLTDNSLLIQENEDDLAGGNVDYISVVTKDGVVTAQGIPVVSYNATTNVITCNHTISASESITAGSYVVFGTYATTHSVLPSVCERYLTEYMSLRIQMRDSNVTDATINSPILQAIEQEIIDSIANLEEDILAIPILDYSFLNYSDDWNSDE